MPRRPPLLPLVSLAALCASASVPSAAEWSFSNGVGATATYTDNVGFELGDARRGETILTVAPFVRLAGGGRRHELSLLGSLGIRRFVDEDRTDVDPNITFATSSELVERVLSFDTTARVSQRSADDEVLIDGETRRVDSTEETYEISLGPSLSGSLGDRFRHESSYTFSALRSSDDAVSGSETQSLASILGFSTGSRSAPLLSLRAGYSTASFEDDTTGWSGSAALGISQQVRPVLLVFAEVGRSWGQVAGSEEVLDGSLWDVGLRWQPTARFEAEIGYGERSYGRRPSASVRLDGRRSSVELAWSRDLALDREQGRPDVTSLVDAAAQPGVSEPAQASDTPDDEAQDVGEPLSAFATNASTVLERIDLSYTVSGRRSTLSAALTWFEREELVADGAEVSDGRALTLRLGRLLSRAGTNAFVGYVLDERSVSGERSRARQNRVELGVTVGF